VSVHDRPQLFAAGVIVHCTDVATESCDSSGFITVPNKEDVATGGDQRLTFFPVTDHGNASWTF